MCRFYGFSLKDVFDMSITQFSAMLKQVGEIIKMESGTISTTQPRLLSAEQQHKIATQMFGVK